MAWQDMIFLVGNFVLGAVLIPTLRDKNVEIPRTTSIPTALTLSIFVYAYYTLDLMLSAISTSIIVLMWIYIAEFRNKSA